MEELGTLGKSALKRKPQRNSIPRAVSYWLFFKRHILENDDIRAQFEDAPLDVAAFRLLVKRVANPLKWGPSFCRRQRRAKSDKTAKRNINDMLAVLGHYYEALLHPASPLHVAPSRVPLGGLGLFARHEASTRPGDSPFARHLWAVPLEVDDATFADLQSDNYPSLYGPSHILCGPLALANHQCGATLAFSLPRKIPSSTSGITAEEFHGLSAVHATAIDRHRLARGDEITIDYFAGAKDGSVSFGGARCRCTTCSSDPLSSTTVTV